MLSHVSASRVKSLSSTCVAKLGFRCCAKVCPQGVRCGLSPTESPAEPTRLIESFNFLQMAHIEPFRAFRYDLGRVAISNVATQPYDKITTAMQERYYATSPYNLVRIILGKRQQNDDGSNNPYIRAAACLQEWRGEGIIRQDPEPSIYRYVQRFSPPTSSSTDKALQFERQGFIALGKIEDYSAGVVFRHEQTLAKPKADRLELLRATRAHFGQIFMLYSDQSGRIDAALTSSQLPVIEMSDEYGVLHRVWKISDSGTIARVGDAMRDKKLIIADGHHRYETALTYRNERRPEIQKTTENIKGQKGLRPSDFVMMTFVNMDGPGLLVLPTHRVVHGLENFSSERFALAAKEFFSVDQADAGLSAERATASLKEAGQIGTAILAVTRDAAFLLSRPKNPAESFQNISLRQQSLDVVQLHKCLLEKVLAISEEAIREQKNVTYVRDAAEALNSVRSGQANIAFLTNPVRIQQMHDIAFAGEVLPQKSTDFYPKLLSGLTIYALE